MTLFKELVLKNRSCRRFLQPFAVSGDTLRELVSLARLTPSAANLQPLKYILSASPQHNAVIFECLSWAAYLEWEGPVQGERPSAYIIILGDHSISSSFGCDCGIAAQTIMLGAAEQGLGGCMIGSVERDKLRRELDIEDRYEILLVLALGKPAEEVVVEHSVIGDDIRYWRDEQGIHHVPKRSINELIVKSYF